MLDLLQQSLNTLGVGIEAFDAVRNDKGEIIDFEYTYINEVAKKYSGLTQNNGRPVVGRTMLELFPERKKEFQQWVKVADTGEDRVVENEIVIDGTEYWIRQIINKQDDGVVILYQDVTEVIEAKQELEKFNTTLETKVEQRTQELQTSNEELRSFAYSVSHDLRSPLRAMAGYAQILSEDHLKELSEDAQKCVNIINDEAKRMGNLIDDLLAFSRMQRQETQLSRFGMKQLAMAAVEEALLHAQFPKVDIDIDDLPQVYADNSMIRQVWLNLINNSIKYKKPDDIAYIKIGYYTEENEHVFFVKDQGVGFDMRYVDKLFGIFQRLHSQAEFEGTGIGLAWVKKVISRHQGRVWAEGKINEGATIYFTLPKKQLL